MATPTPQLRPLDPEPLSPTSTASVRTDGDALRAEVRRWLLVLLRRAWVIAAVTAIVFAAGAIRTLRETKLYTAVVSMVIELQAPKVLGDQVQDIADGQGSFWQTKDFFETQFLYLKSKAVALRVVNKLGLDRDADFLGLSKIADPAERAKAMKSSDATVVLRGELRVEPVRDSHVVKVLIDDPDPKRAALLANTVADEYIAFNLDEKLGMSRAASEWLHDKVEEMQKTLADSEGRLYTYKRENDILTVSIEDSQSIIARRLSAVSDALTEVRKKRAELEAKVRQVKLARDMNALSALPEVVNSPVVQAQRTNMLALSQELADARTRYGEDHPKIQALRERLAEAQSIVAGEESRLARSSELELAQALETEKNFEKLLDGTKREAFEINRKEVDYNRLRREQENNSKIVEMVLRRWKDVDLSAALRTNNVHLLDAAEIPGAPSSPNLKLALLISLLLGLGLGIIAAIGLEQFDDAIETSEDVERATRASFLGIIPEVREPSGPGPVELHVHRRPHSSVAECLRTVRTNLLFLSTDRSLQKLMVTSSGPQEGKTTVVVDLGIAFAQHGQKTLLVDTDMRRPRLHKVFGLGSELGLSSVLLDEKKLGEAIRQTEVPNLWVLPCGPIPPNPAELLHTERFQKIAQELARRFDRVLFDSPPVAAVTDAQILSSTVDGVVLIGKAGKTSKEALGRARRSLADVNARVVGAILNGVDLSRRRAGYYYDYYGRYGAYVEKDNNGKPVVDE
jgi:succinoglycan biosynthesis transport protein ExoP